MDASLGQISYGKKAQKRFESKIKTLEDVNYWVGETPNKFLQVRPWIHREMNEQALGV